MEGSGIEVLGLHNYYRTVVDNLLLHSLKNLMAN
jgi:hypothetical protein